MTTTVSVLQNGRVRLPEPTEQELRKVIQAAGSLAHPQTPEEELLLQGAISEYRKQKRQKRG